MLTILLPRRVLLNFRVKVRWSTSTSKVTPICKAATLKRKPKPMGWQPKPASTKHLPVRMQMVCRKDQRCGCQTQALLRGQRLSKRPRKSLRLSRTTDRKRNRNLLKISEPQSRDTPNGRALS